MQQDRLRAIDADVLKAYQRFKLLQAEYEPAREQFELGRE